MTTGTDQKTIQDDTTRYSNTVHQPTSIKHREGVWYKHETDVMNEKEGVGIASV